MLTGKLYVYGTNEGFDYADGKLAANSYSNHSLSILSTFRYGKSGLDGSVLTWIMETLTNLPDSALAKNKVTNKWTTKAWAPSALKIDGDGDGEDAILRILYRWWWRWVCTRRLYRLDHGMMILERNYLLPSLRECSGVKLRALTRAVLADDKGNAYVYFGGGSYDEEDVQTGRVCKLKFEKGTGKVSPEWCATEFLDTFCFFEDGRDQPDCTANISILIEQTGM